MTDVNSYQKRRQELIRRYLSDGSGEPKPVQTGGIDHLALICGDLDATIRFYVEVLGMRITRIVQNRDDPTSTPIFFDMGGGNQLAFFDFQRRDRRQPYAVSAACITSHSRRGLINSRRSSPG